jgi:hypothetical protein
VGLIIDNYYSPSFQIAASSHRDESCDSTNDSLADSSRGSTYLYYTSHQLVEAGGDVLVKHNINICSRTIVEFSVKIGVGAKLGRIFINDAHAWLDYKANRER